MNPSDKSLAACDKHLPLLLREAVPDDSGRGARIVNVATPDERYSCICRVPAHWFIKVFEPESEPK